MSFLFSFSVGHVTELLAGRAESHQQRGNFFLLDNITIQKQLLSDAKQYFTEIASKTSGSEVPQDFLVDK